jgi:hypothetical protein
MQSKVDDLMRLADEYANYSRYAHTPNLPDNSRAALRAALEAALKECRNTTLEEAAVPITEFP